MKIEEVEAWNMVVNDYNHTDMNGVAQELLAALRAEAWHPIEKADEMGAKDGRWVLLYRSDSVWEIACWDNNQWEDFYTWDPVKHTPTHFRFINPPEGA